MGQYKLACETRVQCGWLDLEQQKRSKKTCVDEIIALVFWSHVAFSSSVQATDAVLVLLLGILLDLFLEMSLHFSICLRLL